MSIIFKRFKELKTCVLIPTYNNEQTLREVILAIKEYTSNIIIINDGSTDNTDNILKEFSDLYICKHSENQGKGQALRTGFSKAIDLNYEHAISIDSDGQHKAKDLPVFLEAIENEPSCLYVGARKMDQEDVPGTSSFGNRFSNFWYRVNTGIKLPDTQSGYRSYPLHLMKDIVWKTKKFEFEIEVLVRTAWRGICVKPLSIDVYYPPADERVSHFRKFRDFSRISVLNTIFVLIALFYQRPRMFFKKLSKLSFKEAFRKYIFSANESNSRIALSIALGVFLGIAPFWGAQMILIVILANHFKLNKAIGLLAGQVSLPPFIPFILYASYKVGGIFFKAEEEINFSKDISFEAVAGNGLQYLIGAFIVALICSATIGSLSYILLLIFRKR